MSSAEANVGRPVEDSVNGKEPAICHSRDRLLGQLRLHYVAKCISGLYYEPDWLVFEGDDREGTYATHDGCGNYDLFAWSEAGLIVGSFDHDRPAPGDGDPDTKSPRQCFPDVPGGLEGLVEKVIGMSYEEALTGGLWLESTPPAYWRDEGCFTSQFKRYTSTPEAAMNGPGQNWSELMSISAEHAALAIELAAASRKGPCTVTPEQSRVLLTPPFEGESEASASKIAVTVKRLAAVGIGWVPQGA